MGRSEVEKCLVNLYIYIYIYIYIYHIDMIRWFVYVLYVYCLFIYNIINKICLFIILFKVVLPLTLLIITIFSN